MVRAADCEANDGSREGVLSESEGHKSECDGEAVMAEERRRGGEEEKEREELREMVGST